MHCTAFFRDPVFWLLPERLSSNAHSMRNKTEPSWRPLADAREVVVVRDGEADGRGDRLEDDCGGGRGSDGVAPLHAAHPDGFSNGFSNGFQDRLSNQFSIPFTVASSSPGAPLPSNT